MEVSIGILFASIVAGIGMGSYFAMFHNFSPPQCSFRSQLITLTTIGWSFLIPLGIETTIFEGGQMGMQWFLVFFLWFIFALSSTATNVILSTRK